MPAVNTAKLRGKRDELNWSNAELAKQAEVPQRYVENIVCGSDKPGNRVILRLTRALGLTVDDVRMSDDDEEATAARRTPKGDPSEPPKQPDRPSGPTRRQGTEEKKKGPRRIGEAVA